MVIIVLGDVSQKSIVSQIAVYYAGSTSRRNHTRDRMQGRPDETRLMYQLTFSVKQTTPTSILK